MERSSPELPNEPVWYAFRHGPYNGRMPAFFSPQAFDWTARTEQQFPVALEALEKLSLASFTPYFNTALTKDGRWKTLPFYTWGVRHDANCDAAPELEKLLLGIPGFVSASFSLLEQHTKIEPHEGDTNAIARCHLGCDIPGGLPGCGLEVNGEQRAWEKGKWLLFCDAHEHRAWNDTAHPRYVLIVDVILPQFQSKRKNICANILSMFRLQQLEEKCPSVKRWPGPVRGALRVFFKTSILVRQAFGR